MLHSLQNLDPLYVLSGVLVGGLVGMTGVGGGSLMTPILILIFRVHPVTAVGTDLLYASATKAAGTAVHGFNRTVDWGLVGRLALGSIPATAVTIAALYLLHIDSHASQLLITRALGVALLLTAISLVLRKPLARWAVGRRSRLDPRTISVLTVLTGVMLGTLVSLSSVGAGAIGVTALVLLYPEMDSRKIVGSDVAHAVPLTLVAGAGHILLGSINLHVLISLLAGSLPAIVVMSMVAARTPDATLRLALAGVLVLVCARFWFVG